MTPAAITARAALAPSVHNTQPARWRWDDAGVEVLCNTSVGLPVGDPTGRDAGLSCGAAVEATVLALSADGIGATVEDLWHTDPTAPLRPAARITFGPRCTADPLHTALETRATWRGAFGPMPTAAKGWSPQSAIAVTDPKTINWIAQLNDQVSLNILSGGPFRRELLDWMRLDRRHPRWATDGLNASALNLSPLEAKAVPFAFGAFWPLLHLFGATKALTAEASATRTAPVLAAFHRPKDESPVTAGRAYLRLCLMAAQRGLSGWPMAALTDDPDTNSQLKSWLSLPDGRTLIQVLRLGPATGPIAPKARLCVSNLMI